MDADATDELLERLAQGDVDAAAELYETYSPYLRAVVRRQLAARFRSGFDSVDVVQSVWVRVVQKVSDGGLVAADRDHLKATLALMARRRVIDRVRKQMHDAEGSRPGSDAMATVPETGTDRPSEIAQADDVWDFMLEACPPEHREILRLRREGLPLQEIANRTGLHEGSVRRIIRQVGRAIALDVEPVT